MKFRNILELIVLLVLIIVLIFFIITIQNKGTKCVTNPLKYTIQEWSQKNNQLTCSCSFENLSYSSIEANKSGVFYVNPSIFMYNFTN